MAKKKTFELNFDWSRSGTGTVEVEADSLEEAALFMDEAFKKWNFKPIEFDYESDESETAKFVSLNSVEEDDEDIELDRDDLPEDIQESFY